VSNDRLIYAIWTPWAELLCGTCHNQAAESSTKAHAIAKTIPIQHTDTPQFRSTCDRCDVAVACSYEDVAACKNLVTALKAAGFDDAQLEQTGGMCVAATVRKDGWIAVATLDEEEGETRLYVGIYKSQAHYDDGDTAADGGGLTEDQAVAAIKAELPQ